MASSKKKGSSSTTKPSKQSSKVVTEDKKRILYRITGGKTIHQFGPRPGPDFWNYERLRLELATLDGRSDFTIKTVVGFSSYSWDFSRFFDVNDDESWLRAYHLKEGYVLMVLVYPEDWRELEECLSHLIYQTFDLGHCIVPFGVHHRLKYSEV